jgi:pimeloyl-ACP methyl ester carboxylesterase
MLLSFYFLFIYFSINIISPEYPKEIQSNNRYIEEAVSFLNPKAGIRLSGTLTYPNKNENFPAVILIGNRISDRDETTGKHKPFFVLADYLTKNGIAVLRFDNRGIGKSEGKFSFLTTTKEDIVTDVMAAFEYLSLRPEIDTENIGLIGHSEGGVIAAMVAAKIPDVAFIILMASPGLNGVETLYLQIGLVAESFGINRTAIQKYQNILQRLNEILKDEHNNEIVKQKIIDMYGDCSAKIKEEERNALKRIGYYFPKDPNQFSSLIDAPGWYDSFTYEPAEIIKEVKCPILVLNGEKDLQVPSKEHLSAIRSALKEGKSINYTIKELPGLNHLFQSAVTGSPREYEKIEETISPAALTTIEEWLLKHIK